MPLVHLRHGRQELLDVDAVDRRAAIVSPLTTEGTRAAKIAPLDGAWAV